MILVETGIGDELYKGAITFTVEGATRFHCSNLAVWLSDKFQCAFTVMPMTVMPMTGCPGLYLYKITAPHYIDPTGIVWSLTSLEGDIRNAQKLAHLLELVEVEDDKV